METSALPLLFEHLAGAAIAAVHDDSVVVLSAPHVGGQGAFFVPSLFLGLDDPTAASGTLFVDATAFGFDAKALVFEDNHTATFIFELAVGSKGGGDVGFVGLRLGTGNGVAW